MAKFTVTAPDGKKYDVEAPEGASEQEVLDYVQANFQRANAPAPAPVAAPEPTLADQIKRKAGLVGRAVVRGLSSPVNMVTDFASGAYNLGANLLGSESRLPYMSQAQNRGLTELGFPEPATTSERAAQAGMEGLVSAGGAATILPKTIFGADLVRQLPAATAAPMAAQPTGEFVKDVTGSDLAAFIASVGVAGAVGQGAGKLADRVATGKQPVVTMDQVRQNAQRAYTAVSDLGIKLTADNANSLVGKLKTRLDAKDYIPENAAPVKNVLDKIESIAARGDVSFDNVDKMRSLANTLKSDKDQNVRRLGGELIAGIDEHVAALKPRDVSAGKGGIDEAIKTITSARKDWRNVSRASMLENILNVAEAKALNPTASESELIRQGFIALAANKTKLALFNEAERNAIRSVAKGGSLDPFLTLAAKFNPQRSQLIAAGGIGGGVASPESLMYTLPIAAGGLTADKLQALLRRQSAEKAMGGLLTGTTTMPAPSQFGTGMLSNLLTQPQQ